jgi:hypothetical protein
MQWTGRQLAREIHVELFTDADLGDLKAQLEAWLEAADERIALAVGIEPVDTGEYVGFILWTE